MQEQLRQSGNRIRLRNERGQVLVEYALLLALISVVSIGVLASLGLDIKSVLLQASSRMSQVSNP
jgi:Flp pilus assembly pilin Flp